MRAAAEAEFEDFVRRYRTALVHVATTMSGGDRHLAEDAVQTALVKVYLVWPPRGANPYGYVRRAVVNALIDQQRRPFFRREHTARELPDIAVEDERLGDGTDAALLRALSRVPTRMRAAVVLRHVEGMSVEETAEALGCSTGNVKSQTARGLDRLRQLLHDERHTDPSTRSIGVSRCLT